MMQIIQDDYSKHMIFFYRLFEEFQFNDNKLSYGEPPINRFLGNKDSIKPRITILTYE